jgi:N6-L-threonylcarbamoyladenine synthase
MKNPEAWEKLGETRDDAVGEAFDKVARMLRLPYPGGPELEKLAVKGDPEAINFPRPMLHDRSYDFSFSGLKTSVLYFLRDLPAGRQVTPRADVAASFQKATIEVLIAKTVRAAKEFKARSVMLSGGVAANKLLRKELRSAAKKNGLNFLVADQKYNTDNAVMIAAAAYMSRLRNKKYPLKANGALNI